MQVVVRTCGCRKVNRKERIKVVKASSSWYQRSHLLPVSSALQIFHSICVRVFYSLSSRSRRNLTPLIFPLSLTPSLLLRQSHSPFSLYFATTTVVADQYFNPAMLQYLANGHELAKEIFFLVLLWPL
jgi:hypothetical protein